jgi:iron-sulfur cluster assembly protein
MIQLTHTATNEVQRLLGVENRAGWGLRVGVQGGGCSGLSYSMQFEENPTEHDRIFDNEGVKVFCDPKSYLYLNGMTLDYSTQLIGGGFNFINPNATKSCSCGTSFSA